MRPGARTLCLGISIAAVAAGLPAIAVAQTSSCEGTLGVGGVNVHVLVENTIVWCSADVIRANSDVPDGTDYRVRPAVDGSSDVRVSDAISINRLLTLARVPTQAVTFTYINRSDGTRARLSSTDVSSQPSFPGGLKPLVWLKAGDTAYLRPLRGDSDTNATDFITAPPAAPLDLYVSSGRLLDVTANASPTTVGVRQSVRLSARVSNQISADGALTYSWDFQDGSTATGSTVVHKFNVAGPYYPVVHVLGGADGAAGISKPVQVTVGSVPTGRGYGNLGNLGNLGNIGKGLGKTGSGGTPGTTTGTGSGGSGTGSGSGGQGGGGSASTPSQGTVTSTTKSGAASPGSSSKRVKPVAGPAGAIVTGRLIADVVPISAAQLAQQTSASGGRRTPTPSAVLGGSSITPLAGIAGGVAVFLLLACGAAIELRSRRRAVRAA
jgi:hypothetical protein